MCWRGLWVFTEKDDEGRPFGQSLEGARGALVVVFWWGALVKVL